MVLAFPHKPGKGGPGSFQHRFEAVLRRSGWSIVYPSDKITPDVVLVVGGTRRLLWLWKLKRKGVPIVYRLDGLSWIHRKIKISAFVFLLCEVRNLTVQIIRRFFADKLIYQSQFVFEWWSRRGWRTSTPSSVIYNGIDLIHFKPRGRKDYDLFLLCLEGTLDYSPYGIRLINNIHKRLDAVGCSLVVYGGFEDLRNEVLLDTDVDYRGVIARDQLPSVYENAVYFSLDINPACPNTVIEALASGIPVVAYKTGSLPELVPQEAGVLVDYGSDPWQLGFPDEDKLFDAIMTVLKNWDDYSKGARQTAEMRFNIIDMHQQYIFEIEGLLKTNSITNKFVKSSL